MKIARLFGVLVMGGAALAVGCSSAGEGGDPVQQGEIASAGSEVDASEEVADASGVVADAGGSELEPCFCGPDVERCCEAHAGAASTVRAGFECCWSSSC